MVYKQSLRKNVRLGLTLKQGLPSVQRVLKATIVTLELLNLLFVKADGELKQEHLNVLNVMQGIFVRLGQVNNKDVLQVHTHQLSLPHVMNVKRDIIVLL